MTTSLMAQDDEPNALPPLPTGHGFEPGDRVSFPVYGKCLVTGTVRFIDIIHGERRPKRYRGLVIAGDDGHYYELDPETASKISK